ncbi:MAG TPA: serine/threonine-protein kinase [Longimicrobiales bacterium]|nr:serine/threonine-protein kinase [Longimicrobiales bacterium]
MPSDLTGPVAGLAAAMAPEFDILRLLGEGSMGAAYLARERELRRLVTIKVPRSDIAASDVVRHRFEREARAAARIRHPSAAAVHRIGRLPDGTPFLVLEYLDGRTLEDVIAAERALPLPVSITILGQLAGALAAAHAEGVVHRDVRPNNVFWMEASGRAVLADFGMAGILESGAEVVTRLTRPGEAIGAPAYRSPEQLLGEPLTPAADVYGLALVAYEVLTGSGPFMAATAAALDAAHLHQPPRDLRDMLPGAPPQLADLLLRCLCKDPNHRPTAAALAASLGHIAGVERSAAVAPSGTVGQALEAFPAIAAFFAEMKRRRVFNAILAYGAISFIMLEGAQLVLPSLPVAEWAYTLLVAATLAGFPVAVMLAWMYDVTASGIQRTEAAQLAGPAYLHWLLPSAGLAASLVVALLIGWWVFSGH